MAVLPDSAVTIASLLWTAAVWSYLKQHAARADRPELWSYSDVIAPILGVLILYPAAAHVHPETMPYNQAFLHYRLGVYWVVLSMGGWIASGWWECETDLETPDSLDSFADRF